MENDIQTENSYHSFIEKCIGLRIDFIRSVLEMRDSQRRRQRAKRKNIKQRLRNLLKKFRLPEEESEVGDISKLAFFGGLKIHGPKKEALTVDPDFEVLCLD